MIPPALVELVLFAQLISMVMSAWLRYGMVWYDGGWYASMKRCMRLTRRDESPRTDSMSVFLCTGSFWQAYADTTA